jgi:hypothetical protein
VSQLLIQEIFVIFNTCLQKLEVLVRVLLQLAHSHGKIVVFLEHHCLDELFLLLQPSLEIGVKVIYFIVHLSLQFLEVFFDGSQPGLYALPVLLCILEMIPQLLRQFGEDALHFTILFSDNLYDFLDL